LSSCTIAASRVTYAYSRDGALPLSRWLKLVNTRTKTPVNAVLAVLIVAALLGLLMFASPIAIGAVFSIGAIAQYTAFIFPIALKLFAAGDNFRPGSSSLFFALPRIFYLISKYQSYQGPWHLGRFSKPIGAVACAFVALMIPVLCFPATKGSDLNRLNMNYSCLIYGGTMSLALWYALDARKWLKGPKINVEHLIHTRTLEGEERNGADKLD